jgi:hypothetical protein
MKDQYKEVPLPAKEYESSLKRVMKINADLQDMGMDWDEIEVFWRKCFAEAKKLTQQT